MLRCPGLAIAIALCAGPLAAAPARPALDPSIGRVEVTLDLPKDKPYVGEMIMLRMRSFVRADVVLDEVRQPPMINFDVQQLGRDKPIQAMVDGFRVDGIERDLAIFPQQSGRLIIDPFIRHVTIVDADNERIEGEFVSKPIYVDVQNHTAIGPAAAWWLPAKSLTITDSWSPEADEIPRGTLSRRTITVEAVGLTADRLPPPPEMRAPGTIAFRGPVDRETTITEDGPVARGTYLWDLRPTTGPPARVPAIAIPWFDTGARRMREAAIPERWVAYIGTLVHTSHEKLQSLSYLSAGPLAVGLAGFAWTAAVAAFLLTGRQKLAGRRLRRSRVLSALRRAARFADERGFRNALSALALSDPVRWARIARAPLVAPRLAAFDAARYGRAGGAMPPLQPLAADIRRLWSEMETPPPAVSALPPLDGALAAPMSWRDRVLRH